MSYSRDLHLKNCWRRDVQMKSTGGMVTWLAPPLAKAEDAALRYARHAAFNACRGELPTTAMLGSSATPAMTWAGRGRARRGRIFNEAIISNRHMMTCVCVVWRRGVAKVMLRRAWLR